MVRRWRRRLRQLCLRITTRTRRACCPFPSLRFRCLAPRTTTTTTDTVRLARCLPRRTLRHRCRAHHSLRASRSPMARANSGRCDERCAVPSHFPYYFHLLRDQLGCSWDLPSPPHSSFLDFNADANVRHSLTHSLLP
ncbi:hypothetical protein M419DRAFT_124369 [Trichoderma reesei RUT C-30]|uniref:Uncharacterized protein n=1 Tax=Hypocrea jecorina (strain ATCC 56765 / BCRC 32924 / NRRL 11460 / Rut C-30) TaxID=1344414 RepID=A0A024S5M4_HYPJR|nr:hypothetical protein M419DRAFT_124369 [Trichoderma reesei RUT C-30]